jgi:arsenate reductase-like glutaredoxin family protein
LREIAEDNEIIQYDYARQSLPAAEIKAIFGHDKIDQFLNTRHAVYKEKGFAEKLPSTPELIEIIIAEPNLLRRPITRIGSKFVVGYDQEKMQQLINGE